MAEKYQREIEEILQKTDGSDGAPSRPKPRHSGPVRRFFSVLGTRLGHRRLAFSPGKLMLVSLALLLSALLVSRVAPGMVGGILLWGALVVFIAAYALFFIRPGGRHEKRWRGRVIEERRPGPTLWARLRRLIKS